MKKYLLTVIVVLLIGATTFSQTPQSFNYQAVLRNSSGQVMANQEVEIGVAILQGSANGTEVFAETHSVTTNNFGLANLQIGAVNTSEMQAIDWSSGPYFIQISVDGTVMGTSQLLSVPFAMHAVTVENDEVDDADADPANELQQIALENNQLSISDGNSIDLSSLINLKDTSATNELQTIDFTDNVLSISNGNSIDFKPVFNAGDTSNTNELQDISLSGTELSISQGSTVDLSVLQDGTGTDNQKLTFYAGSRYLAISNGNSVQLPFIINERDGDDTNELNTSIVLNGTDLELTDNGGTLIADLSSLADSGKWEIAGNNIYNANSGNVGIGRTNPKNKLDVNGSISLTESPGNDMIIKNSDSWLHGAGQQKFGNGGSHFLMASHEGSYESAGIYGDGDNVTIWSPGDGADGQPGAYLYILDEDYFDDTDENPYNNGALIAYVSGAGVWQISDSTKKENIMKIDKAVDKISRINGYSYKLKNNSREIARNQKQENSSGILAQELELVLPEAVQTNGAGKKYVNYSSLVPLLIEGIKEQQAMMDNLIKENETLKEQNTEIEQRLETLEALVKNTLNTIAAEKASAQK